MGPHATTAIDAAPRRERTSAVPDSIVDCAVYCHGRREGGRIDLEQALESAQSREEGFVWIGLHEPTDAEIAAVAEEFHLPALAVEDALHAHQRPKIETYGDITFVVVKTVEYVDPQEVIDVGEVMIFIGATFAITVRHGHAAPLGPARAALEARADLLELGPTAVLYGVLDHVVDAYADAMVGISSDIEEIELAVFSDTGGDPTQRLYKLRREALEFRRAVKPLAQVLDRIVAAEVPQIDPRGVEYFRDVQDHLLRDSEQIDTFSEVLADALSAGLTQVQVRQNEDVRKISSWAAILAVNTLVAGIYGMNFVHMPELRWQYGYGGALAVMVALSTVLYRGFRRSGWI